MKTSTLTGISLTLFMVILVLLAGFVFLVQQRQTAQEQHQSQRDQIQRLEGQTQQRSIELAAAEATRTATAGLLATVESDAVLLEGQLVESQQRVDELTNEAAQMLMEMDALIASRDLLLLEQEQASQQLPLAAFISPDDGETYTSGDRVPLAVAAADFSGISSISLLIDGELFNTYLIDDQRLVSIQDDWQPEEIGEHIITALATNSAGRSSVPVTVTLELIDVETRNRSMVAQIEADAAQLRGVSPLAEVAVTFLTEEASLNQTAASIAGVTDTGEGEVDLLTLAAFDFLAIDYDIAKAEAALQRELGPAVHDPPAASFLTVMEDGEISVQSQWEHIHAYAHFLQAEMYPLDQIRSNLDNGDARTAFYALMEGEADLLQSLYLSAGYFSGQQRAEIVGSSWDSGESVLLTYPPVLAAAYTFPREAGTQFASALYLQGQNSFDLINGAWSNLPQSTEQILHPDRYLAGDAPQPASLPDFGEVLGDEWELIREDTLGEFLLSQYLSQRLGQEQASAAAAGWGGDRYVVYWNERREELVMALHLVWDSAAEGDEFAAAYPGYPARLYGVNGGLQANGGECWQGESAICLYHTGGETYIVRAPDSSTAAAIAGNFNLEQ